MEITFAKRMDSFQEGIFTLLNKKKNELLAQGRTIYNLSVGTPDFKPAPHVMQALTESASKPENYKYSLVERPALLEAMQNFYNRRFGVQLDTKQIMAVNGSQEAMTHICWALCDPGDVVLVPNPGYPIFEVGPFLCGAEIVKYPLYEENGFLPKFSDIPEETAKKAKVMVVSYPANPVCATANDAFYEELIAFAKKYNIIIIHDNAYADIIYDGEGQSFLKYDGASEVGVEYYSLSKTFDLTGARVSFVLGNEAIIQKFRTLRSQIDYGIFYPVQDAAIAALNGPFDGVERQQEEYAARNRALCGGLRSIGWNVPDSKGTMFVWAPIPASYTSSEKFTLDLMEKSGVIVVPGSSFGSLGEGYVRMALVLDVPTMEKVVQVIKESGILE
ncbi:aminotransferase class I/II-fold pyridoxal phosphate-dependent enzyme [Oscillospiraceae bacterium NTUH-002-81]|nr:aminotransferase class I/II-fold pyridoxal phosphate-dependent enzyme [Oscillospiraceae bacterium NTUH-002-81]